MLMLMERRKPEAHSSALFMNKSRCILTLAPGPPGHVVAARPVQILCIHTLHQNRRQSPGRLFVRSDPIYRPYVLHNTAHSTSGLQAPLDSYIHVRVQMSTGPLRVRRHTPSPESFASPNSIFVPGI